MATHPSILAWDNLMDRGAWQVTVHEVTKQSDMTEATKQQQAFGEYSFSTSNPKGEWTFAILQSFSLADDLALIVTPMDLIFSCTVDEMISREKNCSTYETGSGFFSMLSIHSATLISAITTPSHSG